MNLQSPHRYSLCLLVAFSGLACSAAQAQGDLPRGMVPTQGMTIRVLGDMVIDATSRIDVTGRGYAPGEGPGAGSTVTVGPNTRGTGAGHGGIGGADFGRQPEGFGQAYGDLRWPTEFGSGGGGPGGGNGCGSLSSTGSGGGALMISVGGTLTLEGEIRANGGDSPRMTGSGSGGSVLVLAGQLEGQGEIQANGGATNSSQPGLCGGGSGNGGGGRIAVYAAESSAWGGQMEARGGSATNSNRAGAGTIYFSRGGDITPELIIDNFGAGGGFFLENGTTPIPETSVVGDLFLIGGAKVGPPSGAPTLTVAVAGNATVGPESSLDASARISSDTGPGAGGSDTGSGGGGGHGGVGGRGGNNSFDGPGGLGGLAYGSTSLAPPTTGSGGGTSRGAPGGFGGGLMELNAAGEVLLNGRIGADASPPPGSGAGGGSGGGVIIRAGRLIGNGVLSAQGGPGGAGNPVFGGTAGGGGGAGGRIAYASCAAMIDDNIEINASGGSSSVGNAPGQGGGGGSMMRIFDLADQQREPDDTTVLGGSPAEFVFVTFTGADSTFQWSRNGMPLVSGPTPSGSIIAGVSTPVLTIHFATPNDDGTYTCEASGPCGSVASAPASLTVLDNSPPCNPDFDGSGTIDFFDVLYFLRLYDGGSPVADLAIPFNTLDTADVLEAITRIESGCP